MTSLAAIATAVITALHPGQPAPQVVCYPSSSAYFQAARIQPERFWPGGVAGFWGYAQTIPGDLFTYQIGLTQQECANLAAISEGYTWQRAYSVFVLGHEITHALNGSDEHAADCGGLALEARIAYALGLRGHRNFAQLAADNRRAVLGTMEKCP